MVQKPRHATKTMVFSAVLVGGSECAVEYGMRWLKAVINECGCHTAVSSCGGQDLTYLSCEPAVDLNYTTGSATYERIVIDGGDRRRPRSHARERRDCRQARRATRQRRRSGRAGLHHGRRPPPPST